MDDIWTDPDAPPAPPPRKRFHVPGVGAGLIIGEATPPDKTADELLRAREVTKLGFPAWTLDPAAEHTVAPILAHFARVLVQDALGTAVEELPKLRTIVDRLEGTRLADARKHSGKELKRLLVLADHVVRKFLPNAMTFVGGSDPARMLRQLSKIQTAGEVVRAETILDALARDTAQALGGNADEDQLLLVTALSFSGLYVKSLVSLLRTLQDALQGPAPAPAVGHTITSTHGAPPIAPPQGPLTGDVMEVSGKMVMDLVNYVYSVYGASRQLADRSLAGRGALLEVDRMGLACLVEMAEV